MTWFLLVVGLSLLFSFVWVFLRNAVELRSQLQNTVKACQNKKTVEELDSVFANKTELSELWEEYKKTLHHVETTNKDGTLRKIARATVSADMIFRAESMIDAPLRTDFIKNLPGIFTGLGIIGTFSGLIGGLKGFEVSGDPDASRASLKLLLDEVYTAFKVSAGAIGVAMLVTAIEKWFMASLNKKLATLHLAIDQIFEMGVGEEYLSKLVGQSNDSTSHLSKLAEKTEKTEAHLSKLVRHSDESQAILKDFKDELLLDLKDVLHNSITAGLQQTFRQQTAEQIKVTERIGFDAGGIIAQKISETFADPLKNISAALSTTQQTNAEAIQKMLTDAFSAFAGKLDKLLGSQANGALEAQKQATEALQAAIKQLTITVNGIQTAGKQGAEQMSATLLQAVQQTQAREQAMRQALEDQIGTMRGDVLQMVQQMQQQFQVIQQKTEAANGDYMEKMGDYMEKMFVFLHKNAQTTANDNKTAQEQFSLAAKENIDKLGNQLLPIITSVDGAVKAMEKATSGMTVATNQMSSGAGEVKEATKNFSIAGTTLIETWRNSTHLVGAANTTADNLNHAAIQVRDAVREYKEAQSAVQQQIQTTLPALVEAAETAKRDVEQHDRLIAQLAKSTDRLVEAQKEAGAFLNNVSDTLAGAYESFTEHTNNALAESNKEFLEEMSLAVTMLKEVVQDLEATLGSALIRPNTATKIDPNRSK